MASDDATATGADPRSEPCCTPPGSVDEDAVLADVQLLSAAGNDTRYELLRRIAGAETDVCVCDLEAAVGVSQSAVSQALSRLSAAGLVTRRKEGSWRYYGTTPVAEALLDTLDDLRAATEPDEVASDE
ncbi:putative transcription regulator [Salinarchaeum sp. Harcht-Bsk1]|uniref:ArsR/SmtB family transcription factor n=1 Tax=Salinarchaeum sp. Harcht-Bsk1 TaxID=1333523 RepID=UPI00034238B9|nr:metalloregulator ArsR/SmtB family transcription factor [Salinarchaeum sp. Harcht-Bsk1]AGN00686.1 putative transcription regulator [Salinarchaeum sp. Harcht-Bsk1]